MRKTWRLDADISTFQWEGDSTARSHDGGTQGSLVAEAISHDRDTVIRRLIESPVDFDRWVYRHLAGDEGIRTSRLFHNLEQQGGDPTLAGHSIYHGGVKRVETADVLRVWLRTPPRTPDVYFNMPDPQADPTSAFGRDDWRAMVGDLQQSGTILFFVGSFYREDWHALRYLAASASLVRIRNTGSPTP